MSTLKINLWVIGLAVMLVACGKSSDDLLNQAKTQKALGHYDQALQLISQAQAILPDDEAIFLFAADIYESLGDIEISLSQCILGLEKNPESIALLLKASQYLSQADEWEKARTYAEKAFAVDEKNPDVLYQLGELMLKQGLTEEAFNWYNLSFEQDSISVNALIGMGKIKLAEKNAVEAETYFNKAKKINPMTAEAFSGLAQIGELNGQDEAEIISLYQGAIKRKNNIYEIWEPYLGFMISSNRVEVDDLKSFNKNFPDKIEGHYILAQYYMGLAQLESETWLEAAIKECDAALAINYNDDRSHGLLSKIYLMQKKPRLALLRAQIAFEINPLASYRELVDQAKTLK